MQLGATRVLATVYEGKVHPVPPAHIQQRSENWGSPTPSMSPTTGYATSQAVHHELCGCEVADFIAQHFSAAGWAA